MIARLFTLLAALSLSLSITLPSQASVLAADLIMARSQEAFPEAMLTLQTSIKDHGYKIARVQRIDIGLTGMGYKTDKYRVVFVGKTEEIQYLSNKYPQLTPYLPPKVSIYAEADDTVIVTPDPSIYKDMIDDDKDKLIFDRWESDIHSVFNDFATAADD